MFSAAKDEWATPALLFEKYNDEFRFGLDAAATYDNAKCLLYLSDALSVDWRDACQGRSIWLNPPYSKCRAFIGKAAAEAIDPTAEDAYWRQNHASRPYSKGSDYDTYQPAYRYGWEARNRYPQDTFEAREAELQAGWSTARGQTQLEWENAKLAARDAWNRVGAKSTRSSPG